MSDKLIQATAEQAQGLCDLVNSAYRGEQSRLGWTTEADLLEGQRTDLEKMLETISDPSAAVLFKKQGERIVGCVYLKKDEDSAYVGMLTVLPEMQNQGLGRQILEEAEKWVQQNWKSKVVRMTVIVQRHSLLGWYERRGYTRTGKMEPFPYGDERFGIPRRQDLEFEVLEKTLEILNEFDGN